MPKQTYDFGMGPLTIDDNLLNGYTPDPKTVWLPHEVMIFGSNKQGEHHGGAARFAFEVLNAEWGMGEGRSGQTYAFPTLNFASTSLRNYPEKYVGMSHMVSQEEFAESMLKLKKAVKAEPDKLFYMTKIGLGIAGWDLFTVHKLFWESGIPLECSNLKYPIEFEMPDDSN